MTPNADPHRSGAPADRRVLVVEDDEDILESMSGILVDAGYRVDACMNGRVALDRLQQSRFDAVVLDLMMPVMNGWEFVTAKKADPSIAEIPIVAISADSSAKATAIRAESYIPKPFDANDLVSAVGRVLLAADRRKLAQRLDETERLVLLGTIAAGVGHEISNPLCVATAGVELSEHMLSSVREKVRVANRARQDERLLPRIEGPLDQIQGQLQDCHASLDRIRLIVRDLRTLSRRAGDERTLVDVGSLLESVISLASGEIISQVDLVCAYEPVVRVLGNETRLGQVFLNLLVNAAQSIPEEQAKHKRITVAVRQEDGLAVVEVRDPGRGMSGAQIDRIFEPFFTTKGQQGGIGLGLAISKEIVEAHGGTIQVASALGLGSTFTVRLPMAVT
jgi:two-component system, NtrC family, sensor kinase